MYRAFDYDAYIRENRVRYARAWIRAEASAERRPVRNHRRAPDEIALLDRLALGAWTGARATGELKITGPRRYRLRV